MGECELEVFIMCQSLWSQRNLLQCLLVISGCEFVQIAVKPKSAIDFARHVFMDFDQDNAIELWLYLLFFSRFQEKQKPIWLNCNFVLQVLPLSDMI